MSTRRPSDVRLAFHGAARTVTGSRYLLSVGDRRILIDCGLFQGLRELRERNWQPWPFDPTSIDQVLLTHAHIDHAGALPRLVQSGYPGPIYSTPSTLELSRLLLVDSAKIHEEDARYANKRGFTRHKPALPLYTVKDAKATLKRFKTVDYDRWLDLGHGVRARYRGAGHILGSASLEVRVPLGRNRGEGGIVFSGDIGRYGMPLHVDPVPMPRCEVLISESTYGDRLHDSTPIKDQLEQPLVETFERGGTVLIPAFAVGRSQQITLILRDLMRSGRLPEVPVHIDSPMAVDATRIYSRHLDEHHLDPEIFADGRTTLFPSNVTLNRSVSQSKELNDLPGSRIIVSASGMLSGGRVLHHLRRLLPDARNLVILAGYQAAGTRGRKLLEGAPTLRMHGMDIPVRAETISLHGLSAHADRDELVRWMTADSARPQQVYLTHGESEAAFSFARHLRRELGWHVEVPALHDEVELRPLLGQEVSRS